jgi:hypothetical protein
MKWIGRRVLLAVAVLAIAIGVGFRVAALRAVEATGDDRRVALVYLRGTVGPQAIAVRDAYAARFGAAHTPIAWLSADDLTLLDGAALAHEYRAIVLTDDLSAAIPEEIVGTLESFAAHGGDVAVVGDAGSRTLDGRDRPFPLMTDFDGVEDRSAIFDGPVFFESPQAALRWGVAPVDLHGRELVEHGRGAVRYPFPFAVRELSDVRVDADVKATPVLTVRSVGRGEVAYIGLSVGSLDVGRRPRPMTMLIDFLEREPAPHPFQSGVSS